ncbi:angiopoietin-related protein 1-like [Physella acuta]|uniref:angiopoietin-related protein 1-like n=1 Tax=Physella acuta TaxID=109671 RepID=UPI0027DD67A7|nr:angiopoietin-related protein 1-like [Physella acuta]
MWGIAICSFIFIFIGNVFGLKFTMEGEMYTESDKVYCGQLVCVQDLESQVASLVNMSIYSISDNSGKVIIAHLSEQGLLKVKDSPYQAAGQMTQTTAKLTVSVEGTSGCGLGAFLCQLYFVDPHWRADVREVFVFPPPTADESSPDLKFSLQLEVPWSNKPVGFRNQGKSLQISSSKNYLGMTSEATRDRFNQSDEGKDLTRAHEISLELLKNLEINLTKQIELKMKEISQNVTEKLLQFNEDLSRQRNTNLLSIKNNKTYIDGDALGSSLAEMEQILKSIEKKYDAKFKILQEKLEQISTNLTDRVVQLSEDIDRERKYNVTPSKGDKQDNNDALRALETNITNALRLHLHKFEEVNTKFEAMHKDTLNKIIQMNETLTDITVHYKQDIDRQRTDNGTSNKERITIDAQQVTDTNTNNAMYLQLKKLQEAFNKRYDIIPEETSSESTNISSYELKCDKRSMSPDLPSRIVLTHPTNKKILCDTTTDGGGWIIFFRRTEGDLDFDETRENYKHGFGSFSGDFWLGNEFLAKVTARGNFELRADMRYKDKPYYAVYDFFKVESESSRYKLRIGAYTGNAGNSLSSNANENFDAMDTDTYKNCPRFIGGGWWFYYNSCEYGVHPTGYWKVKTLRGMFWRELTGINDHVDEIEMKFRRK